MRSRRKSLGDFGWGDGGGVEQEGPEGVSFPGARSPLPAAHLKTRKKKTSSVTSASPGNQHRAVCAKPVAAVGRADFS